MSLPDVHVNEPHVNAHNDERHVVNTLLDLTNSGRLSDTALSATYAPGGTAGNINNARGDVRYVGKYAVYDVVKDGGADPTGASGDLGAIINAGYGALIAGGGGKILIPPGDFRQTTPAVVGNGRLVSVVGYGAAITRIQPTSALAGLVVLDINGVSTFSVWQAAKHGGFTINGTNCPTAAGLNYGDLTGGHLDDIDIDGFDGVGGVGLQFINRSHWTERTVMTRVVLGRQIGNSDNWAFTVSGGTASFGYTRALDVRINLWAPTVSSTVGSVTVTNGSATVTVPSGGFPGVTAGMGVSGTTIVSIAPGTTVQSVSGNTLTLSMPAGASDTTLYFGRPGQIGYRLNANAYPYNGIFTTVFNIDGGNLGTSLPPVVMLNNAANATFGFMDNQVNWSGEKSTGTYAASIIATNNSATRTQGMIRLNGVNTHRFGSSALCTLTGDIWLPGLSTPSGDLQPGGIRGYSQGAGSNTYALATYVNGTGNYNQFTLTNFGELAWGSGAAAVDVGLKRAAAGTLGITSGGTTVKRVLTGVPVFSFQSGTYIYPVAAAGTGTATHVNNQFRATAAFIPQAVTITRMGAEVTSVGNAGAVLRLGIYADNNGVPGSLILDAGTIAADAPAVAEVTLGTPLTLNPGWYWFGGAAQNAAATAPTVRTTGSGAATCAMGFLFGAGTSLPSAGQAVAGVFDSTASGALASTFTNSGPTGSPLRVFLKLA